MTECPFIRYAIVTGARSASEVAAYLPGNYRVLHELVLHDRPAIVIEGRDASGWNLDSYVIPRLASGLYGCREIGLDDPVLKEVLA